MNQYDSSYISYLRQNKSEDNSSDSKNVLYMQMLLIIVSCLLSICIYFYSTAERDVAGKKTDDILDSYHTGHDKGDYIKRRNGYVPSRV